jgi:hypothetical protein
MMEDPELPPTESGLRALLRQRADTPPLNPHLDNGPWDFLTRASAGIVESRVRPLLHELAGDDDALVRQRALEVLMQLPTRAETIARLLDLARHKAWTGQARTRLEHALANWCDGSGRETEIASVLADLAQADDRLPAAPVAVVLGVRAPDAAVSIVARHAGPGAEAFSADVASMFARFHPDRVLALLGKMRALSSSGKQRVLTQLKTDLALPPDARARLAAVYGVTPSASMLPTLEACAAALGV